MTTREKVLTELKDILAVSDVEDEIAMQDSVLDLVETVFAENDGSVTEDEQDQISELVYDLTRSPAEIAEAIIAVLSAEPAVVAEDVDPFVDDIWDDISDEEVAALTADGPNYAEFSDHHYQEGCDGKECKEAVEADQDEPKEEIPEAEEAKQDVKEAYYGKDSIIDGDIPGKENSFIDLITMRFHNMGLDEYTHPIYDGESIPESHSWCPYKKNAALMFGPDEAFFQPAVDYIKTEENREDSSWYQRPYAVVKVGDRYNRKMGEYALCIFATNDDFCNTTEMSRKGVEKAAELRRMRKGTKPAA
jgi:hypothetical protein